MTTEKTASPLLTFPCEFVIKVFGKASDEFETAVLAIIRKHVPDLRENALQTRLSKDNNYLALTITFHAETREQVDNIYHELSANPLVIMSL